MRLLIVSHTGHYIQNGRVVALGATVRELDHLAGLFDEVVHLAYLHDDEAPGDALPYGASNVRLRLVRPSGGASLRQKAGILAAYPQYARAIWEELNQADAVHVRCPANISLLAIVLLTLRRLPKKRWVKYAGNWQAYEKEALSYRLQRAWLKRGWARAQVSVNGWQAGQPDHVHTFLNPCLLEEELIAGRADVAAKRLTEPIRLLYVGRLEREKGVERGMQIVAELRKRGIESTLTLIGDGSQRKEIEAAAAVLGVDDIVRFEGRVPRPALAPFYANAHFFVMPTVCSEGWPKVLSEGMAYGVVPLASTVSSIPQYLEKFGTGRALPPEDIESFAEAIRWYVAHPDAWRKEALRGVEAAKRFSYTSYLQAVERLFNRMEHSDSSGTVPEPLWPEAVDA